MNEPIRRSGARGSTNAAGLTESLQRRIGARRYDLWFGPSAAHVHIDGATVRVDLASEYVADWIGRHFSDDLRQAARESLGDAATVSMQVAPQAFGRGEGRDTPNSTSAEPRGGAGAGIASRPERTSSRRGLEAERRASLRRLDEFVVGPSNQLALDAGRRLAEDFDGAPSLFFVHGDCGVGKTHLIQGICERRRALAPRQHVRYTTAEQFTNEYLTALREGSLDTFRKSLRRLDLLAIDDIHFLSNKTATQSEFLHTMDAIDLSGARIVLASDEHPKAIRKFSQQLVSRFLSGMVVRIERPDRETRLRLVRQLAAERGLAIQPAAEELIALRCVGSVREIAGALARIAAFAQVLPLGTDASSTSDTGTGNAHHTGSLRTPVGAILVERALAEEGGRPTGPVRLADILEATCHRLGVEREEVLGTGRHRRVVLARSLVVHLARELTTHSFPEIARALGRDTHSSAHTAARRVDDMIAAAERVECPDPSAAGRDCSSPITELVAQLRHAVMRAPVRS